jgi:hypothetical protein
MILLWLNNPSTRSERDQNSHIHRSCRSMNRFRCCGVHVGAREASRRNVSAADEMCIRKLLTYEQTAMDCRLILSGLRQGYDASGGEMSWPTIEGSVKGSALSSR